MLVQRAGAVLGDHGHRIDPGVGHVAERKVDRTVRTGYRHGCHRTDVGKTLHAFRTAAGENDSYCFHLFSSFFRI